MRFVKLECFNLRLCPFPLQSFDRREDDQKLLSGRPQPFSGRRGHVDTQIFLARHGDIHVQLLREQIKRDNVNMYTYPIMPRREVWYNKNRPQSEIHPTSIHHFRFLWLDMTGLY